jgi:ubiquinone/menaquinone biosynthesis C-methylase UbiE
MKNIRVPETDHGITGTVEVSAYDEMQRGLRDKGWIETDSVIKSGITAGHALEIGHGPGYLGLEWLKKTEGTRLTGLDISPDMTCLAQNNAREYGVEVRVEYRGGEGNRLPFDDASFDAVFTNGSLHEWVDPEGTFDEIHRVLKPGGRFFISDLRRDMPMWMRWFLWLGTRPAFIRPYLLSSIDASYTREELREMVGRTRLKGAAVNGNLVGSEISGSKTA